MQSGRGMVAAVAVPTVALGSGDGKSEYGGVAVAVVLVAAVALTVLTLVAEGGMRGRLDGKFSTSLPSMCVGTKVGRRRRRSRLGCSAKRFCINEVLH